MCRDCLETRNTLFASLANIVIQHHISIDFNFFSILAADQYINFTTNISSHNFLFGYISHVANLGQWKSLRELILDDNLLDEAAQFPTISTLETLSLNKNKISLQLL